MTIQIEQTLHGYEVGHQLLMSSTSLTSDAKQTLLVQTDLSGSNVDEYFKSYITGYPLLNFYAFSKTWYADEMPRPGCVWTQTLLIAFADLGKIPDLEQLSQFFKRPIKGNYEDYSLPIILNQNQLDNGAASFNSTVTESCILSALYDNPEKPIFYPAFSSIDAEQAVYTIWSSQWPRLRRNFLFCTGALSAKFLEKREFDLQIVPKRNLVNIEIQFPESIIVKTTEKSVPKWIEGMYRADKNKLRRFLWVYGSDIPGHRRNFKPLIELYLETLKNEPDFYFVADLVSRAFGGQKEGIKIKTKLFGSSDLFDFNPKDLLYYLVTADQSAFSYMTHDVLSDRLISSYRENLISARELFELYALAGDRLSADFWQRLAVNDSLMLSLVSEDNRLVAIFSDRLKEYAKFKECWLVDKHVQESLLRLLESSSTTNWDSVFYAMMMADAEIIFTAIANDRRRVAAILKLLNVFDTSLNDRLFNEIFRIYRISFIDYVRRNHSTLSPTMCNKVFRNLNYDEIKSVDMDAAKWLEVYKKISEESTRVFASCILLSFGFNRKVSNPAGLVLGCFSDVYHFAKHAKISGDQWGLIPQDMSEEEEDTDIFGTFFNALNLFSPRRNDIPTWDYCELLVRTLVNKFIKYGWPRQALLECLTSFELTQRFIAYSLSFKKGVKLFKEINSGIQGYKLKPLKHQILLIDDARRSLKW